MVLCFLKKWLVKALVNELKVEFDEAAAAEAAKAEAERAEKAEKGEDRELRELVVKSRWWFYNCVELNTLL